MKQFYRKHLAHSVAILMLSSVSADIWAEDERVALPTITLEADAEPQSFANGHLAKTAQLTALGDKDVIDTPFSVTTYTSKMIEDQQSSTLAAVLKNDPSIRISTNQGHFNENFQVRGFVLHNDDVALNGLYGMGPTSRLPTEFLQSITVLKGPNALVGGMSPTGNVGAVLIANMKRADQDLNHIGMSFDGDSYYKSHFDFARRFGGNDQFGVRVNAVYADGEHIIDNMQDRLALGSIAADYRGEKLKLNVDAYSIRENRDGGSPAMVSFANINQIISAPKSSSNYFSHLKGWTNSQFAGVNAEYQFTPELKAFAGAGYVEKEYAGHMFGTRMILTDTQGNATSQYYSTRSKEHNVSSNVGVEGKFNTGVIQHTLGLRADYLTRKYNQHKATGVTPFNTNLYQPSQGGSMPAPPVVVPYKDDKFVSYTLTDQISMLNDKLQFILGARYQEMDTRVLTNKTQYKESKLSPSLAVVIKPWGENSSLYASYVEGLSAGTTINNPKDANDGVTFAPYQTKQYEIGAKYQQGSWLNTFAIYQIEKPDTATDKTYRDPKNSEIIQITTDGKETRSRGVEWTASGEIYQGLNLLLNAAYTDTKITRSPASQATEGNTQFGTPKFAFGIGLDYQLPFVDGLNVNTRVSHVDSQYINDNNDVTLPSFTIVDVGARYKTRLGGVETSFMANIDNVANKKYWEGMFNPNYALIGAERTYKVGVSFDF
ncbi:TonB-dependent receptor [Acinetobacter rudis]|uniref:TonB-dependent receptor n=1 Tax=Acinetobacter rudis TaxID=632955 RepID=UPI00280FA34F|nr:TonB-dependent receptor [Acinetobacter rudis]MDQ8952568.1 TonB-dependent receptor [Acinetobacter rudis]